MSYAASERRRTRCVYCGTRISGTVGLERNRSQVRNTPEAGKALRVACTAHWPLVLNDPAFDYYLDHA